MTLPLLIAAVCVVVALLAPPLFKIMGWSR